MASMTAESTPCEVSTGFYGRTCRGESKSGDLAFVKEGKERIFVAIVDAAGHGQSAHHVANNVEKILSSENTDDLIALVQSLHLQLKGGLGAVIIVGILDKENLDFTYIHIGDVHGKVIGPRHRTLVGQAGMLGNAIRTPKISSETLIVGETLVLCTDGISERYDINEIKGYRSLPIDALARRIVEQLGNNHDDATCLVVRCE